jgi:hypothetical protein
MTSFDSQLFCFVGSSDVTYTFSFPFLDTCVGKAM